MDYYFIMTSEDLEGSKHIAAVEHESYGACTGSVEDDSSGSDIHKLLEAVNVGWFHVLACLPLGGIMFAEGAELLITTGIAGALQEEWQLTKMQKGTLSSLAFCGLAIGTWLSGIIADKLGRLASIRLAYICMGIVGMVTAAAQDVNQMMVLRLLNGVACGIGLTASWAMWSELFPSEHRATAMIVPNTCICLGQLFSGGILLAYMPDLTFGNWRMVTIISSIPSFVLLPLVGLFLVESPHWLAVTGKGKEAREAILRMATGNGTLSQVEENMPSVVLVEHDDEYVLGWGESCWILMSSWQGSSDMIVVSLVLINGNLMGFGMSYFWPQALREAGGVHNVSPAACLTCVYLAGIPAAVVGYFVMSSRAGHRVMICLLSLFACVMLLIAQHYFGTGSIFFLVAGFSTVISSGICYLCMISLANDTFPTRVRGFAVGTCLTIGRIASIVSPWIIESVSKKEFLTIAACAVLCNCLYMLPLRETKKQPFEELVTKSDPQSVARRKSLSSAGTGEPN